MPSRYYQDRLTQLQEQVAEALQKQNKVKLGDGYLVRIPRLPGKIRLVPRDNGGSYVEYIYEHWYDKEEKQSRNKKAIIGITIEPYKDAMLPNDNYTDFFDMETGKLLKEEAAEKTKEEPKEEAEKENEQQDEKQNNQQKDEEQEAEEDKEAIYDRTLQEILKTTQALREQNEKKKLRDDENKLRQELYNEGEENPDNDSEAAFLYLKKLFEEHTEDENMKTTQDNHPDEAQGAEQGKAQNKPQTEQDEKQENKTDDYTLEQNYDIVQQFRERTAILVHILRAIQTSIQTQAKKHPDVIINQFKAEKINVILSEIKDKYAGTGYEDLLELIEEPGEEEKDGRIIRTGPTYSDVDVLLAHYVTILKYIKAKV